MAIAVIVIRDTEGGKMEIIKRVDPVLPEQLLHETQITPAQRLHLQLCMALEQMLGIGKKSPVAIAVDNTTKSGPQN